MLKTSENQGERYAFIDALRGIAAFGVMFFHIINIDIMAEAVRSMVPDALMRLFYFGAYGVQIFFVISGFVIAHSLRNNPLTAKSIGNFALRRQIRLDPPYWLLIVVTLILARIDLFYPMANTRPLPDLKAILLNFVYLHKIMGVRSLVDVAWTLCVEIQFYIAFLILLVVAKVIARRLRQPEMDKTASALVFITGVLSLIIYHAAMRSMWFPQSWFYFAGGALCYWSVRGLIGQWVFLSFMALFSVSTVVSFLKLRELPPTDFFLTINHQVAISIGLFTLLAIYIVGRKGRLAEMGNLRVLQYLGKISYSLYLVHIALAVTIMQCAHMLTGENGPLALVWCVLAVGFSIGVAHLLHIAIEAPSTRLAARLKPVERQNTSTTEDVALTGADFPPTLAQNTT